MSMKDQTGSGLASAKKGIAGLDSSLQSSMKTVRNWSLALSTAMVGAAGFAVKMASDFEKSMANINTVLGDNQEQFLKLQEGVKEMSKSVGTPLNEMTDALYDIVSAGIDAEDQLQALADSEKLSVAGLGTIKEATDLVTSSMNAFGVSSEEASQILFNATKFGKVTVAGLAQGFGEVAGTANQLGVSLEELMSITSASTLTGQSASQTYTQLKQVFNSLIKPTTEMEALFSELGVSSGPELIETSGGIVGALEEIMEATGGNITELGKLFSSTEAMSLVNNLMGASYDELKEIMGAFGDDMGALQDAYDKQMITAEQMWGVLKNKLSVTMIDLGNVVLPYVIQGMEWLSLKVQELTDWWNGLSEGTKDNILQFAQFAAVALALTTTVSSLGVAIFAVLGFLSPLNLAIIAVAGSIAALIMYADDIKAFFEGIADAILHPIESIGSMKDAIEALEMQNAETQANMIGVLAQLEIEFENSMGRCRDATEILTEAAREQDAVLKGVYENMTDTASEFMAEFLSITGQSDEAAKIWGDNMEAAAAAYAKGADNMEMLVLLRMQRLYAAMGNTEKAAEAGQQLVESYAAALGLKLPAAEDAAWSIEKAVEAKLTGHSAHIWGANLGKMFADGVSSQAGLVAAAANNLMSQVASLMAFQSPTEEGPGSDSDTWAPNLVKMFADGIRDTASVVYDSAEEMMQGLSDRFYSLVEDYQELEKDSAKSLSDMVKKHKDAVSDMEDSISSLKSELLDLQEAFSMDMAGANMDIGSGVFEQQQKVKELQASLAEATDPGDIAELSAELQKEQGALESFFTSITAPIEAQKKLIDEITSKMTQLEKGGVVGVEVAKYDDLKIKLAEAQGVLAQFQEENSQIMNQVAEEQRLAGLTEFERFLEEINQKKAAMQAQFDLKQSLLLEEISAVQAQKDAEIAAFQEKLKMYSEAQAAFDVLKATFLAGLDLMAAGAENKIASIAASISQLKEAMSLLTGSEGSLPNLETQLGNLGVGGVSNNNSSSSTTNVTYASGAVQVSVNVDGSNLSADQVASAIQEQLTRSLQLSQLSSI